MLNPDSKATAKALTDLWKPVAAERWLLFLFLAWLPIGIFFLDLRLVDLLFGWAFYLVVEMVTEKAWDYSDEIRYSPFSLVGHDVNLIIPFGWLSILMCGLTLGRFMELNFRGIGSLPEPIWSTLGIFLSGIVLEHTCVRFKVFAYNDRHWLVNFGFDRPAKLLRLPATVWGGYLLTGLLWSTLYRLTH